MNPHPRPAAILISLLFSLLAHADETPTAPAVAPIPTPIVSEHKFRSTFLAGHNLTSTSSTAEKGQFIVGHYAVVYGLTDQLMIGTSPWIIVNYNMPMLNLKYAFTPPVVFDHASIELMYFKTAKIFFDMYHQKSYWARLTGTKNFSSHYILHTSFGAQYFETDDAPFSMRPPPIVSTPWTLSLSLLQEIHISQRWGFFLESGLLGINYDNKYFHYGASGFYQWDYGYIQIGLSKTMEIGPKRLADVYSYSDWRKRIWRNDGEIHNSIYYSDRNPIHPEIQIQFLL